MGRLALKYVRIAEDIENDVLICTRDDGSLDAVDRRYPTAEQRRAVDDLVIFGNERPKSWCVQMWMLARLGRRL